MTIVMPVVPVYDLWLKCVVIRRKSHKKSVLIKTSCVKGNAEFIFCVCNHTQQNETCYK